MHVPLWVLIVNIKYDGKTYETQLGITQARINNYDALCMITTVSVYLSYFTLEKTFRNFELYERLSTLVSM